MQSLDSSCQEADTIINDALLKLKGSAIQSSSSHAFRQTHLGQSQHNHQYQTLTQQQTFQSATHHNYLQQSTSSLTGLQPPSHQPPAYLFDEPDSPPDFQTISANISDHDLLAAVNSVAAAAEQQQQQQQQQMSSLASQSLLSNINSIISPSPVVPDMLLNTSPTSPSTLNSCLKTEKRTLLTSSSSSLDTTNIGAGVGNISCTVSNLNNNQLYNSSPSKKPKLTNASIYGEVSSSSSPILQPLLSSSSSLGSCSSNNSNNVKLSSLAAMATSSSFTSPSTSLLNITQQQNSIGIVSGDIKCNTDQMKSTKVCFSTSTGYNSAGNHHSNILSGAGGTCSGNNLSHGNVLSTSSTNASSGAPTSSTSMLASHSVPTAINPGLLSLKHQSGTAVLGSSTAASSSSSTSMSSNPMTNSTFFDIHGKIRELYLYLLIHDEKGLKDSRRKHRTRSFVLERLVDREKLNTIVLNLYPGNKGYSLAFYQDDNQIEILNDSMNSTSGASDCIGNNTILGDGGGGPGGCGGTAYESGNGNGGHLSNELKSGIGSSRLKQTQINNSSLNNRNSNNLFASKTTVAVATADIVDLDAITMGNVNVKSVTDNFNATHATGIIGDESGTMQNDSSVVVAAIDKDDDDNLLEIMSWPYEVDDLLNSIDKEELPIFISDLLEARIPNVFYSGCVICQVRDYRQTFPISSNSCDIFHVLLKPTNEMLFADINQIAIDADISSDDKLFLESQLILATAEPLCLDPDPKIGRYAINSQYRRQIWNTRPLRRQMKKYSQISINRKRKIDQFTHHYGLELCDYLQRLRQRPRPLPVVPMSRGSSCIGTGVSGSGNSGTVSAQMLTSFTKLQKKPAELLRPIRAPNLDYPQLVNPESVDVMKYAKAYKNRDTNDDFLPVLIEEYTLEHGQVYLAKLSIYQRPATTEYLGELYVDKIYKQGSEHKFSLGTRANANRYIQQFTEVLTEAGRKAVRITHRVPGQPAKASWTSGCRPVSYEDQLKLQQQQQQHQQQHQQIELNATQTAQQMQQLQQQQQQIQSIASAAVAQSAQIQPAFQTNQILAPALNATNPNTLPGNQLNINVQGTNIVGITTAGGSVQQLRQTTQPQIFDASTSTSTATVNVQTQPGQQISLSNGSLVFVQQTPSGPGLPTALTIQAATNQQKAQIVSNSNQLITGNPIRTQLGTSVPILQAQLKAGPIVAGHQQPQIIQQKVAATNQTNNPVQNTYVTGFMNVSNTFQQAQPVQQQQTHQVQVVQQQQQQHPNQAKSASNAAILSLLNSAPAAMTSTPISSTFSTVPQGQNIVQPQQQQHATITTDNNTKVIHNLLNNNLRKINIANSCGVGVSQQTVAGQNRGTNLIAVSLPTDGSSGQSVRVTMSALASQLASPPALMTNSNFGYGNASTTNNNNNIALNNNNIKILNNSGQRIISASALRRDSLATAAPSPGSDSNASNTSATSNLGFTVSSLNALLATSPSPGSDQSQTSHMTASSQTATIGSMSNQALFERLNSGTNTNSPGLSPQQQQSTNVTKNLVQHVTNVQSPANASISPLSSPPPQPSPQQPQVVQQSAQTTTTLNLQGINLPSLQGAIKTFPGLQNVQVQIPGVPQPISFSLSGAALAAASANVGGTGQGNAQPTSLLVSVPVTSTTQVNTIQTVPGSATGTVVSAVPVTGAATQTVVLTNVGNADNSQTGSMISLPIAQLVASGVKGLNPQTIRSVQGTAGGNVVNATNIIQASSASSMNNATNTTAIPGSVNIGNSTGTASIQLLGTLQQRPRSIQVVGTKPITTNRGQIAQRNLPNTALKLATNSTGPNQITTTANITATPLVMTTQKLQLKLQKQHGGIQQQQQQQQQQHSQTQQTHPQQLVQQQQHIQLTGASLTQQNLTAAALAAANQKRRRSATDVNK